MVAARMMGMSENEFQYLVPYKNGKIWEGRICLFYLHTNYVKQIKKFTNYLRSYEIATTKDKVGYFIWHCQFCKFQIFTLNNWKKLFEIFDLNTRQINRGNVTKANRLV